MANVNLYRSQFRRLAELDRQIRAGKHPNCSSFARDYEVSRRTIARDIEFLKEKGAPLEFDGAKNGYRYTDRSWQMPMLDLSEGELLQLLVAERMAAQYKGTPLAGTLSSLFEKLAAALPDHVSVDPVFAGELFSFHGRPTRKVSEGMWIRLATALRECKVLRIQYANPLSDVGTDAACREVEPIHLACLVDEWYLVAHCRERDALRHFAVSRITSAKVTGERFEPPDFDPEEYFSNRFGRFIGKPGETYNVVVRFAKSAAPWILERTWHPKQKIKRHRDGSLTLSFPAPALYEVKRWILSWGADASVVGPPKLRSEANDEIRRMAIGVGMRKGSR